jgi:RNA polymerase sigma-70 factor (ECF subfamily)
VADRQRPVLANANHYHLYSAASPDSSFAVILAVLRDPAHPPLFAALLRHYDELVDHVRRRFGDRHFARDVLQDVCVQLLERPPAGEVAQPLAFLRHVSTHRASDRYRAESTRQTHADAWQADAAGIAVSSPDVAEAIAHRQAVDRLEQCIAALPPRCQEVFILHRLHELPQQDVALRLGISRGMVARHMARAMALLAPELQALGAPPRPETAAPAPSS